MTKAEDWLMHHKEPTRATVALIIVDDAVSSWVTVTRDTLDYTPCRSSCVIVVFLPVRPLCMYHRNTHNELTIQSDSQKYANRRD